MYPIISVVIPCYNAARYIHSAICSMLNQSIENIEIIIVDDGSTDNSVDIVKKIDDPRIFLITESKNQGYPSAMNSGIEFARGEYIARMDADDVSDPKRLETQLKFLIDHPQIAFVGSWRYWLSSKENIYPEIPANEYPVWEGWESVYYGSRRFADPSVLVSMKYVKEAGRYRTYQRSGQDVDLWLRILEQHPVAATLPEYLYGRRLLPSAITFSEGTFLRNKIPRKLAHERRLTGSDQVMRGEEIDGQFSDKEIDIARDHRINMLWDAAKIFLASGDRSTAWAFMKLALSGGGWKLPYHRNWVKCLVASLPKRKQVLTGG